MKAGTLMSVERRSRESNRPDVLAETGVVLRRARARLRAALRAA
jgi:hypothetical protein